MKLRPLLLLMFAVAWTAKAHSADWLPGGVFVQGGAGQDATRAATVGVIWPWAWRHSLGDAEVTGLTEVFLSHWSTRAEQGRRSFTQVGAVVPLLRYRFSQGRSPWFLEAGIGIAVMDPIYRTAHKEFSTRFNFVDVLGIGHSFGERHKHELGLRLMHLSNGGIQHPNPGENLVQLRYALMF
ncbi:MAG: acyloxyacyl hydrolase [Ramlibacter sp.]